MIYVDSLFCVLYCDSLCFFDKLQPIIAQFDLVLFDKIKKADNSHIKS